MSTRNDVDERIRELYELNGRVTPDMVIEDAKNPESPLNDQFNWNVEEVAMSAWRHTARKLINSVKVVVEVEEIVFKGKGRREFIADPGKDEDKQGYITRADLSTDRELALKAMRAEVERVEASLRRARNVAADLGLLDELEIANTAIIQLREKTNAA